LYTGRVGGEGGGHVTHHNFFTILGVDEALADPTASPLLMTMFDAIHEDEGDSEVTTQTLANHANEAASAEGQQPDDAGESIASPHRTPACSSNVKALAFCWWNHTGLFVGGSSLNSTLPIISIVMKISMSTLYSTLQIYCSISF